MIDSSFNGNYNEESLTSSAFYKLLKKNNKDEIHAWLTQTFESLIDEAQARTEIQRDNLIAYRGIDLNSMYAGRQPNSDSYRLNKYQKLIVNHLYDLTETKVSQFTRIKPAVEVLPANDEWTDRTSAKVTKLVIDNIWYSENADKLIVDSQRSCRIFGEHYVFIGWDENKGDLHPDYVEVRDTLSDKDAEKAYKSGKIKKYVGDICYTPQLPWRVYLHRALRLENSDYVFSVGIEQTDKLRDKYKDFDSQIDSSDYGTYMFDVQNLQDVFLEDSTLVIEFFHKKTTEVPNQYYAKFTISNLLENGSRDEYPTKLFSHGKLPFVRLTDLDVPDVLNGVSRYETIKPMQRAYDNLTTLILKNIYLTAHAKWVMPRGACNITQLGNDNTVVQYQGAVAPQLVTYNSNNRDVYEYRNITRDEMSKIYATNSLSMSQLPDGVTSKVAMQYLNELENERATTDVMKHNQFVAELAKMTIAVAGDLYDIEDGRLIRIVGTNNKYSLRHFDTAHLSKPYDVRVTSGSALPEMKAAKYERVLEMMQRAPQMMSPERWEELLDTANPEKAITLSSEAYRAADSIVEDILAGREVAPLEEWHDLVPHWETYAKAMQSRGFSEEAEPQVRAKMKDFVYWTEEMMFLKAQNNPEFEARLATLTLFPIFQHSFPAPRSREDQMIAAQGAHNRGEPTDARIAGHSPDEIKEVQFAKDAINKGK